MTELEKEKVKVPVRKTEQKVEQEQPHKAPETRKQQEMPRRWGTC